jgi:hypothetical protein
MKKKLSIYLAGAMEKANKLGSEWREAVTPFLEDLGLEVLNPVLFEPEQLRGLQPKRLPEGYTHWHDLRHASDEHLRVRFKKYMRRIINYDINIVKSEADFILVLWDESAAKGAGTHAELTEAFLHNKPVYCVEYSPLPAWAYACCSHIRKNWDEMYKLLAQEFGDE